jgi:hypothetical protein
MSQAKARPMSESLSKARAIVLRSYLAEKLSLSFGPLMHVMISHSLERDGYLKKKEGKIGWEITPKGKAASEGA